MTKKQIVDLPVQLTDANRLYLYRLLSNALGIGRQSFLPRAVEALEAEGITPEGLGHATAQDLFAALDGVCELTAFKGGRFYVTVTRNETFDAALAAGDESKKSAGKGKPWKRKKGALKPVRPKMRELKITEEPIETPPAEEVEEAVVRVAGEQAQGAALYEENDPAAPKATVAEVLQETVEIAPVDATASPDVAEANSPQADAIASNALAIPSILEQIAAQAAEFESSQEETVVANAALGTTHADEAAPTPAVPAAPTPAPAPESAPAPTPAPRIRACAHACACARARTRPGCCFCLCNLIRAHSRVRTQGHGYGQITPDGRRLRRRCRRSVPARPHVQTNSQKVFSSTWNV